MQLLPKHKLLIAGATLIAAGSAGGAYAAAQSDTNPRQAFINDVARRLHVSPAQLQSAFNGALIDRLDAMVKAGQLTKAQAKQLEQRIENGRPPLLLGPPPRLGFRMHHGPLEAASSYLGLTRMQLFQDLRAGQSLAQIAKARGKSVSGLERALITAARSHLDRLVTAGIISQAQEQRLISRLSAEIGRLVNRSGPVPPMPPDRPSNVPLPPPGGFGPPALPPPGGFGPPAGE
jgi:AraC-like DNA-binding protein